MQSKEFQRGKRGYFGGANLRGKRPQLTDNERLESLNLSMGRSFRRQSSDRAGGKRSFCRFQAVSWIPNDVVLKGAEISISGALNHKAGIGILTAALSVLARRTERPEATRMKRMNNIKREYIQNHNDEGKIDVIQMI